MNKYGSVRIIPNKAENNRSWNHEPVSVLDMNTLAWRHFPSSFHWPHMGYHGINGTFGAWDWVFPPRKVAKHLRLQTYPMCNHPQGTVNENKHWHTKNKKEEEEEEQEEGKERREKREEIWSDFSVDVQKIVPHNPCGFLMWTNHQLPEDWVSVKGWDSPATSFCREQHNNRMHQLQFNFIQSWVMIGFFPHWKLSNWLFCISPENCACTLFWDTRPARFD